MAEHQNELAANLDGNVIDFLGRTLNRREPLASEEERAEYRQLLPKLRALTVLLPALTQALTDLDKLKSQAGCPAMRHILNK